MPNLLLQLAMVLVTMILFVLALVLNSWLFARFEFVPGINWVYLPAGMRLLCTLVFKEAGAMGLLLVSWLVCFFYFFPDDFIRAFMGGILAAAAPYLAYLFAQRAFGLEASLANLSPKRLLACVVLYALASPVLHHLWFAASGHTEGLWNSLVAMVAGDLLGSLIVVYAGKLLLMFVPRQATLHGGVSGPSTPL